MSECYVNFCPLLWKRTFNQPMWFCKQIHLQRTHASPGYPWDAVAPVSPSSEASSPCQAVLLLLQPFNPPKSKPWRERGEGDEIGEGPGFVHKQKAEGENNNRCHNFKTNTILPLWKSHCSPKEKTLARGFRKGARGQKQWEELFSRVWKKTLLSGAGGSCTAPQPSSAASLLHGW